MAEDIFNEPPIFTTCTDTSVSVLSREHWARWARWARRAQTLLFHTLPNVGSIGSRSIVIASIFLSRKADRPKRRANCTYKNKKTVYMMNSTRFFVAHCHIFTQQPSNNQPNGILTHYTECNRHPLCPHLCHQEETACQEAP